jgi:multidrug efflux pump subunit AcrA (membrane-fusion protein)
MIERLRKRQYNLENKIMKEKLKNLIQYLKLQKIKKLTAVIVVVSTVVVAGVSVIYLANKGSAVNVANAESVSAVDSNLTIAIVGEEESLITGNNMSNNSWPGEIISLSNLQVQPDREGTISGWNVRIGEKVRAGQVIGKLSRPPQMPDAIMALSEKSQMLGEARTSVEALRIYTAKRITQLQQLRTDTENSNKQKIELLKSDTGDNDASTLSLIASKKKLAQVILRGSISNIFPMLYGQGNIPPLASIRSLQLRGAFGAIDLGLRNQFSNILFEALSDLRDTNTVPEKSGLLYFNTAIKLVNASVVDGEMLTETDLETLKQMLVKDQSEFIAFLGEIKSMELEKVNVQRESIDKLAEIDSMVSELEKELAMSEGDFQAKEIAYKTINGAISGGYSIVAPNAGIVSSIMKKPGEFVGPGMPVATVTTEGNDSVLVRMRIPNNIQKPMSGELFSIVRPGFGTDVQKVRLVGVGSSLDEGSYMADAVFTGDTKWPIGSSVRIIVPVDSSSVLIKYSSVFWDENGAPLVWAVSEADRVFSKKITIGRTLGTSVEVYTGLKNGDRYIANPNGEVKEDMLLGDLIKISPSKGDDTSPPAKSGKDKDMGGMPM